MDRRLFLWGVLAAGGCTTAAPGSGLLERAVEAAGGRAALDAVKELAWTGEAAVHFGGQSLELGVETVVRPFVSAKSVSWPKAQGRAVARTLIVGLDGGRAITPRGDAPLPEAQLVHERLQFGLYALMLLPVDSVSEIPPDRLLIAHAGAPQTEFRFDAAGRMISARNRVPDAEKGARMIAQEIAFEGIIESNGVRWPKSITIRQDDAPYFDLRIATFEARATAST